MKRQIIAVLLVCMLVGATFFTGCGEKTEEETKTDDVVEGNTDDSVDSSTTEENSDVYGAMKGVTLEWNGPSYKPYRYMDETGGYTGYDFDVVDALSEILGFDYNYTEAEFAGTLAAISVGTVGATDERKESMDFTRAYYVPKTAVLVKEDSEINGYADLIGKRVCGVMGSIFAKNGEQIKDVDFFTVDSDALLGVEEVMAGRADAIVSESVELAGYQKEYEGTKVVVLNGDPDIDFDMLVSSYHYAFKNDSEYVDLFNKALDILAENGTLASIQEKWLGADNITDWSIFDEYEPAKE